MKIGWQIQWNVTAIYLRNIQDILSDGKTPCEMRWSGHSRWRRSRGGDTRRDEGRINVLSWYRLVDVTKPLFSRKGGRTELSARVDDRHVVRRRQSSPIPVQEPAVNRGSKACVRVIGKAGENGQHSGEKKGGSSPWTRPSVPECGDTLKALANGRFPFDLRWGSSSRRVAIDWVFGRSTLQEKETAQGTVRPT